MASPRLALFLLPALAFAGCSFGDDGPRTAQNRAVAGFTRVEDEGSPDVHLHVGSPQRVQVHAGRKVIGDVHTEVRDGTLHVSYDHHGFGGGGVTVEAWVPNLTGVRASGSGDIRADGITADSFVARVDGSGDLTLQGQTARLALELDGSGTATSLRSPRGGRACPPAGPATPMCA